MTKKRANPRGADARFVVALATLGKKPADAAKQPEKKRYSERVSAVVAKAIAGELRRRGLKGAKPDLPGDSRLSGAERRMAGGIGAKKVDVTWATEEAGLLLAVSVKSINFKDSKTKNYQKNLINRRGDMLFESVTLHRRFPYAVLVGFFILDEGAKSDQTDKRASTFDNAHERLALFTGRSDPAGREEQYETLYIVVLGTDGGKPSFSIYPVSNRLLRETVTLDSVLDAALALTAERNPDFYRVHGGMLVSAERPNKGHEGAASDEDE